MNVGSFILENSRAFLRHNKKTNILIVLSLIASLLPLYISFANIQYFISSLSLIKIHETEKTYLAYVDDGNEAEAIYKDLLASASLKQYEQTDFIYGEKWMKVTITYLDDVIDEYENIRVLHKSDEANNDYPLCAIEKNLLKFYDINIGNIIKVNGKEYRIAAIVNSIYNLQSIILPRSELTDPNNIYKNVIYFDNAGVLPKASPTLVIKHAADVCNAEMINGLIRSLIIMLVGGILLIFAITNISMIFIGEFEQTKTSVGIRRLLGAEINQIKQIILIKNLILILISDFVVYATSPLITWMSGTTIDLYYSFGIIVLHCAVSCIIAFLLTQNFIRRMKKYSLIDFIKNGD